jgi:tRNA(fMet)-specific endonuclease VapC
MGSSYLLDTNTASFIVRASPPEVLDHLDEVSMEQTAISTVTEAELLFGIERKPNAKQLRALSMEFLERVTILPWDSSSARSYSHLRTKLETAGRPLGAMDMMIASQALAADLVLVSSDRAFRQVPGLKLEDWTVPLR